MNATGMTCGPPEVVNLKNGAVLARYDHVVSKSTGAHMVERNRGVVRQGAPETKHKRREGYLPITYRCHLFV